MAKKSTDYTTEEIAMFKANFKNICEEGLNFIKGYKSRKMDLSITKDRSIIKKEIEDINDILKKMDEGDNFPTAIITEKMFDKLYDESDYLKHEQSKLRKRAHLLYNEENNFTYSPDVSTASYSLSGIRLR
jgi:hypothetical protein